MSRFRTASGRILVSERAASGFQRWAKDSPILPHFALRIVPFQECIVLPSRRHGGAICRI